MRNKRTRARTGAGVLGAGLFFAVSPAFADVGFLLPNRFHADESGRVTVIASFSDRFPNVEHALRSDDFHIADPEGERQAFESIDVLDQLTVLSAKLNAPGVYRLSTGERLGRKGEASRVDGAFVRLGRDGVARADLPEGAPIFTSQTATVSEVHVRKGDVPAPRTISAAGRLTLKVSAGDRGFEPGAPLQAAALFDGAPLEGARIVFVAPFGTSERGLDGVAFAADADGEAAIMSDDAGPHVVFVRHIAEAPPDAQTDLRSYTTALIFELRRRGQ